MNSQKETKIKLRISLRWQSVVKEFLFYNQCVLPTITYKQKPNLTKKTHTAQHNECIHELYLEELENIKKISEQTKLQDIVETIKN